MFGRRAQEVDSHLVPWTPNPVPIQVLTNVIAGTFDNGDGDVLQSGINSTTGISLSAATVATLSPPAQAAYHLLDGDEHGSVNANLPILSPQL